MKKLKPLVVLCLFFITTFTPISAQGNRYAVSAIPEELKKDANQVYRLDYTKYTVKSSKDITLHVKKVITIFNKESHEMQQGVSYDKNSKVFYLRAMVYDAAGKPVREARKAEFTDHSAISGGTMYSDSRYKIVELNHNTYPYTIEFEYKKTFKGKIAYPSCYIGGFETGLENLVFIAEMWGGADLRYKSVNIDLEPEIEKGNNKTIYKWAVQNQPPIMEEEMMPYHDQIIPHIKIGPSAFQYDGYKGDFSSWQSYGQFFYDINKTQTELSPGMSEKVKELIRNASTDKEKIEALYRYLQDNTRYVSVQLGIGGFQAFDAGYVEMNQYGDCKALSNYMLSMLKEANVKAYHAIIYRDPYDRFEIDKDFAAHFANHMIIYLPDEDIWLECTSNDYPLNYLGESNDNRPVMLLTEKGGKLVRSPSFKINENTHHAKAKFKISDDGSTVIESNISFYGPKHEWYRYVENNYSNKEKEEWFLKNTDLPAFSIEKLGIKSSEAKPEAEMDFQINVLRYASKAGKRIFVPLNKLNAFDDVPSPTEKRHHPIQVIRSYREIDEFTFELPEGYEVESIPNKEIELETSYGKYFIKIKIEGKILTYNRLLEINAVDLPPKEFEEFRNFRKEIAKADGMKVVLVKKT